MKLRKKLIPFLVLTACLVLFCSMPVFAAEAYGKYVEVAVASQGKGSGNRKCLRLVPVCHCLFKRYPRKLILFWHRLASMSAIPEET